jgi:hypothetical protein
MLYRMNARGRILCLPVVVLALCIGLVPASAQAPAPKLVVFPNSGRPNDHFYLAGGGFPPAKKLDIFMFCPSPWHDSYGHWQLTTVPAARIKTGSFVGWRVQVPTPFVVQSTSCVIDSQYGSNPLGVLTTFKVIPSAKLGPGMAIAVRVRLGSGSAGLDTVDVKSAPGAKIVLSLQYASGAVTKHSTVLPWTGHRVVRWRTSHAERGRPVRMVVTSRLGSFSGQKIVRFAVQH